MRLWCGRNRISPDDRREEPRSISTDRRSLPKAVARVVALCGVRICRGKAGASEMRPYQGCATDLSRGSGGGVSAQCDQQRKSCASAQVGGLEPTVAREHVCGPDVISTATVKGAREGARVEIMSVGCPQTAGRASRSGQVPDYLSRNIPSAYARE